MSTIASNGVRSVAAEIVVRIHRMIAKENWNFPNVLDVICEMYPEESEMIPAGLIRKMVDSLWPPTNVSKIFGPRSNPPEDNELRHIKMMFEAGFTEYHIAKLLNRSNRDILKIAKNGGF